MFGQEDPGTMNYIKLTVSIYHSEREKLCQGVRHYHGMDS